MSIATPEGLELELVLAGAGSRFIAGMLDTGLRLVVLVGGGALLGSFSKFSGAALALDSLLLFVLWFGYDIAFELLAGGQTPGKRWTGLRVMTTSGESIGAGASVVRNLLRLVDALPGIYLVGIVLVALTRRHQRVGDLVAGTVVVRDRRYLAAASAPLVTAEAAARTPGWGGASAGPELTTWDVSGISAHDLAAVRRFLERRSTLDPGARGRLAHEFASRLLPLVVGPTADQGAEEFLENLVAAKSQR